MQVPAQSVVRRLLHFSMISCLTVIVVGCAASHPSTSIHEATLGKVFLEQVSDKSFQAAHTPIKLSEDDGRGYLAWGTHERKNRTLAAARAKPLKSTNLNDIRTFSEDDIAYLAPHITTALAQATPNQRIGFHVYSGPEISQQPKVSQHRKTTAGYLFADGLSLHFTLTQYRYRPGQSLPAARRSHVLSRIRMVYATGSHLPSGGCCAT